MLITVFVMESVQPLKVITLSLTLCIVIKPANICVTSGEPGKLIVVSEPSSHVHIQVVIYDENPEGTYDALWKLTGKPTQLVGENVKSGTGLGLTVTCFVTE